LLDKTGNNVAAIDDDFGHFDDNSDSGPYSIRILNAASLDAMSGGTVVIHIDPNGNDTWRFNLTLTVGFSDGSRFGLVQENLELSQDHRDFQVGIQGRLEPLPSPPVPPWLAKLLYSNISFHTNNEDKDSDTHVTVELYDYYGNIVARTDNDFGHFSDNSNNGPYGLMMLAHAKTLAEMARGSMLIRIDPNGHDTWRFNFTLTLSFEQNYTMTCHANGLDLNQDRKQQTFGLDGIQS